MKPVRQRGVCLALAWVCTSCIPLRNTLGFDHKGPDEFGVVPLAPLSVPKELRDPQQPAKSAEAIVSGAGKSAVQNLSSESQSSYGEAPEQKVAATPEVVQATRLLLGDPTAAAPVMKQKKAQASPEPKIMESKLPLQSVPEPAAAETEKPRIVIQKVAAGSVPVAQASSPTVRAAEERTPELAKAGVWKCVSPAEIKIAKQAIASAEQKDMEVKCNALVDLKPEIIVEPEPSLPPPTAQQPPQAKAKVVAKTSVVRVRRLRRKPVRARRRGVARKRRIVRRRVVRRKGTVRKMVYKHPAPKAH